MEMYLILVVFGLIPEFLCSQTVNRKTSIPSHLANIAVLKSNISAKTYNSSSLKEKEVIDVATPTVMENVIGETFYDLQSNSSIVDKVVVNLDGTISSCWAFEPNDVSGLYVNRGTGYNYYNGISWQNMPTSRVENVRVNNGSLVNTRSGREVIISQNDSSNKIHIASRNVKGSGPWINSETALSVANVGGNICPRIVTSMPSGGDTIYVISLTKPVVDGGLLYQGLDGAVVFSRSIDAGLTWDIQNIVPAGLTSATYLGFSKDKYAITAKGSTVAIVAGDSHSDVTLAKSIDGGVTWISKTVLQFPLPLWDYTTTTSDINNDAIADTIETNDGHFAIALNYFGDAYVAYGAYRLLNITPTINGYYYFPYTDGLYLWNENPGLFAPVRNLVASIEDLGLQGAIYFPTPTVPGDLPFGNWECSLTSFPSMTFDTQGTYLYLTYSSVVDSMVSVTNTEKLVRHQYVMKGHWQCVNWGMFGEPLDIVPYSFTAPYEGVFGSIAKSINQKICITYMRDYYPGNGVPFTSGINPDLDNLGNPNEIVCAQIGVYEFTEPCMVEINEPNKSESNLNLYPNPASNNATIDVTLSETAKLDIAILNTVGQTIYTTSVNGNVGSNKVDVNLSNLSAGLYFYQVKVGNSKTITKKFAVEK